MFFDSLTVVDKRRCVSPGQYAGSADLDWEQRGDFVQHLPVDDIGCGGVDGLGDVDNGFLYRYGTDDRDDLLLRGAGGQRERDER
jgi:hypothetical protein